MRDPHTRYRHLNIYTQVCRLEQHTTGESEQEIHAGNMGATHRVFPLLRFLIRCRLYRRFILSLLVDNI